MTPLIVPADVMRFRAAIERRLGLNFDDDKRDFLAEVMRGRLEKSGAAGGSYLTRLESETRHEEWQALGQLLTVPETYFFRHYDQLRAFAEVALRDTMQAQSVSRRISILSAGCASGEEAYSLAMMAREAGVDATWKTTIVGADINPAVIEKAAAARYSTWALRETPAAALEKWFRAQGRDYSLDESIRRMVRFEQRNLAEDDPHFWQAEAYDVIFCRNMMMYFSPASAKVLIERLTQALVPGGYLFLGHAETLRGLSQDFHLCHTHDTFYYRRRTAAEPRSAPEFVMPAEPRPSLTLPAVPDADETWMDTIRRSAERIQTLANPPAAATGLAGAGKSSWDLRTAHDLLRQERFAEALNAVRVLPAAAESDVDALLLRAVLCVHSARMDEAEQVCRLLLDIDDLNAGAQYVLALCREDAGDRAAAISHNQTAAYLDPAFAMPRLHLGLLARRGGDGESARRELELALTLLQREDSSRLLLFGGGFGRDALLALCRAELAACGGRP